MLDEVSKAILVVALLPDGTLRFVKNTKGSRIRQDGLATLAAHLCPADKAELFRLLNPPGKKMTHLGAQSAHNDACPSRARD